jgi:hypothetical protein
LYVDVCAVCLEWRYLVTLHVVGNDHKALVTIHIVASRFACGKVVACEELADLRKPWKVDK